MGYRSRDEGDLQARDAVAELAQAGREARSTADQAEAQRLASLRQKRLWYAVPTLWKPLGQLVLVFYPFVVLWTPIQWAHETHHWSWLPLLVLAPVWPAFFFLRRRHVRRAIQAELAWARSLRWPLEGYAEWIALEQKHILITFAQQPDYQTIEDALSGAVNRCLKWEQKISFDRQTARAIGIQIPDDLVASGSGRSLSSVHFGDTRAFHALIAALLVIDRVTPVESVRFTTIELFGYEPMSAPEVGPVDMIAPLKL